MNNLTVSVVIPAYNEEENIEDILTRTNRTIEEMGIPCEVIVVDDGSTDETSRLAERHKATILSNGTNKGKGHALRIGVENAIGDIIVTMDADGSHQPEEIPRLLKPMQSNTVDIVSGSRFLGTRERGSIRKLNIFGNSLFNLLIFLLTQKRISDSQTGFRAFKKAVIEDIRLTSEGYDVETELTVKALKKRYVVQEEPITCTRRKWGSSHLDPLRDGIKILKSIIKVSMLK